MTLCCWLSYANSLAQTDVPPDIVRALRLGRITALQKPDNGVRGIVVGEFIRRLVACTLVKQLSEQAKEATAPYQYALVTRAECECVAHVIQALTDLDDNATVVSVDGVGAFDLISENSMLSGLMGMREGEQLLPFAKLFFGDPSTYLWEDVVGDVHHIHQGDALMPMLFCFGQHGALRAIAERLLPGEKLFA